MDAGREATPDELLMYEGLALFLLYLQFSPRLERLVVPHASPGDRPPPVTFWRKFKREFHQLFRPQGRPLPSALRPELILAGYFQGVQSHRCQGLCGL